MSRIITGWQHFCVTWDSYTGDVAGYHGGTIVCSKDRFQDGKGPIYGGGKLYIGQLQTSYSSGLRDADTFTGYTTGFNLWSSVLLSSDIQQMSSSCQNATAVGSALVKWSQLVQNRGGEVAITTTMPWT